MEAAYKGMTRRLLLLSGCIAFAFGLYDGFFGPGTGSFLLFAFLCAKFDFWGAAANASTCDSTSTFSSSRFLLDIKTQWHNYGGFSLVLVDAYPCRQCAQS